MYRRSASSGFIELNKKMPQAFFYFNTLIVNLYVKLRLTNGDIVCYNEEKNLRSNIMRSERTRSICLCAVFAALTAIGAFIKIPVPVCPFTLQLLFTTLAGLLLGKKLGTLSVAIYVIIGLLGVPVFTQGGGFGYVMQPTFGYLLGYIAGAFVTGMIVGNNEKPGFARLLIASLSGLMVVYLFGMVYLYVLCNYVIGSPYSIGAVVLYCFVLAVPGDIVLCFIASALAKRLIPVLRKGII